MPAARRKILIRRVAVGLGAAGLAAVLAIVLLGGGDSSGVATQKPSGVPEQDVTRARGLSVADQIDQVMLLGFDGSSPSGKIAGELAHHQLGGVLIDSRNWGGAGPGTKLITSLEKDATGHGRIAPVFATAQEPGDFRSLPDLPPKTGELALGNRQNLGQARADFEASADALRKAGIMLDLAPDADVATIDSPFGAHAFSDDPLLASSMTEAALKGCNKAGVACAPGRFPGLGAATQDTDEGPATVSLDPSALEARDLLPFTTAIADKAPALTVSLAFYSAYDAVTPAALAPSIATDLLRDKLRFHGVAITDDLGAGAIKATETVPRAAVMAIAAGSDMVRIDSPRDQKGVREALTAAVNDGTISKDRLASAAARVLELKSSLGID